MVDIPDDDSEIVNEAEADDVVLPDVAEAVVCCLDGGGDPGAPAMA